MLRGENSISTATKKVPDKAIRGCAIALSGTAVSKGRGGGEDG